MNTSYYIQFIISSLLVIGLLLFILKFSKKYQKGTFSKEIKLIDRFPISQQSSILLIEIKNKQYIIGATGQQISLIDKQ